MTDRSELADFLRRRREQLRPEEIGGGGTVRRRTPGLRREEVAMLAGVSVDYYARLEQGRERHRPPVSSTLSPGLFSATGIRGIICSISQGIRCRRTVRTGTSDPDSSP